ncbi:MAG TPA: phosphatase PAP2 family protein, partial [Micromonosporaceae bacterium]
MAETIRARRLRPLIPVAAVSAAAVVFAVLLVLVRTQWSPLESVDRGTASDLNGLVSGDHVLVAIVKAVTWLGSDGVLWTVTISAALVLAIRQRWRLSAYLLVTGAGALVLDPVLKSLVGRLRPVVAHPVAHGLGNSFPSGHALGSIVCYGALMLVFVPAARGRWRTSLRWAAVALVVLIGVSRLLLGVHYVSDVVGAWAVGVAWLGLTTFTFEVARWASGQAVTHPVDEGLEPEARTDLAPAEPEAPSRAPGKRDGWVRHARVATGVLVAWVLIVGLLIGIGHAVIKYGGGNLLGDETIPHWFAAHRTPTWTRLSAIGSTSGATQAILFASLAICVVFLAATRRWRPVVYVATLMVGELGAFLVTAAVVRRARPDVPQMDQH